MWEHIYSNLLRPVPVGKKLLRRISAPVVCLLARGARPRARRAIQQEAKTFVVLKGRRHDLRRARSRFPLRMPCYSDPRGSMLAIFSFGPCFFMSELLLSVWIGRIGDCARPCVLYTVHCVLDRQAGEGQK
jgi:hypothetical protein